MGCIVSGVETPDHVGERPASGHDQDRLRGRKQDRDEHGVLLGKTVNGGVELRMDWESTAVAIAGLALHDMIKSVDPAAVLGDIHLIEKTGGKRGHWVADASEPADHGQAVVIVSSTSTAAGTREDLTGPAIAG